MSIRKFVVFTINKEEFGLDIGKIIIIERMLEIYKVPNTPAYVEGLTNLRGKVHTIFNLRRRFHLPSPEFDEDTKIIIANAEDTAVGLIVDGVREIVKAEDNQIEPAPKELSCMQDKFLIGTLKIDDRLILLLDIDKVITEPDEEPVIPQATPAAAPTDATATTAPAAIATPTEASAVTPMEVSVATPADIPADAPVDPQTTVTPTEKPVVAATVKVAATPAPTIAPAATPAAAPTEASEEVSAAAPAATPTEASAAAPAATPQKVSKKAKSKKKSKKNKDVVIATKADKTEDNAKTEDAEQTEASEQK